MINKLRYICKKLDWNVTVSKDYIDISQFSPAGEDFFFTVTRDNFVNEIISYAENFDADEHAEMWVENMHTVSGVPQSIRELINDADAIKEMLLELANEIRSKYYDI